ncbi:unnamed protein product [Cuscuta epithymum]|uniref:GOLD domain-containing protein n=1 Tax=Cuscuta epithymum TaxID=186058 RepID=A0AAV0EZP8_9ASTE|nr:unnamed protein product [Cuscuta epithymum]
MYLKIHGFTLVLTLGLFLVRIHSLRFDLDSGHTKCIAEDMKSNAMTVGKYHVVNPNDGYPLPDTHKINLRVTSSYGNTYHQADNVGEGQFAFQTAEAGDYMACFSAQDHKPPIPLTVDFDWKTGIAARDWTSVVKKGSVEAMELELKKMHETVQSIHDEMFYLREREEEMQELNRSTHSKMNLLSFLSVLVALSVAGLQVWYLKTFFEKKKLI